MKVPGTSTAFLSLAALLYATVTLAEPVQLNFNVGRPPQGAAAAILAKRDTAAMPIEDDGIFYMVEVAIGSDNQRTTLVVDTGSSDMWVISSDVVCICSECYPSSKRDNVFNPGNMYQMFNGAAKERVHGNGILFGLDQFENPGHRGHHGGRGHNRHHVAEGNVARPNGEKREFISSTLRSWITTTTCTLHGSFNTDTSDSFRENGTAPQFQINYADGTEAWGTWGRDRVSFGDISVANLSFAIGEYSSSDSGILGIGLPGLESTVSSGFQYLNLPAKLKADGIIQKSAYSIYLNTLEGKNGTVLFGGVDRSKYTGSLITLPMVNTYFTGSQVRSTIALKNITVSAGGLNFSVINNTYGVLLDTGATYSYVSESVLRGIGRSLGGILNTNGGFYLVDCPSDDAGTIDFDFNGIVIQVPLSDLTVPYSRDTCALTIFARSTSNYFTLGNNFLRSAYVVFDLEDEEISIARVNHGSTPDIVEISNNIPGATRALGYSSTSIVSSFSTEEGFGTLTYATVSASLSNTRSTASSSSVSRTAWDARTTTTMIVPRTTGSTSGSSATDSGTALSSGEAGAGLAAMVSSGMTKLVLGFLMSVLT